MKAAILYKQNSPLIIDEIEIPENLEYGQVLVKVYYSSICGSQIGEIKGIKGKDKYLPHLLGHEGSGKVIKIGPGVSFVKINDFVVMHWKKGLGIDSIPAKYKWPKKNITVNSGLVTTFSEYSIVSENRLTKINNNTDLKLAPLFGCAITTGFGIIKNDAVSSIGDSIVVIGCGGVGINTIIAANLSSNYPIIAVDIDNKKLNLAKKFGADIILNAKHRDFIYKLDKLKKNTQLIFVLKQLELLKILS